MKQTHWAGVLIALAAATAGCGGLTGPDAREPLTELPRELSVAERSLIASGNDFGLDLFSRLAAQTPEENVVFSPLSAYLALGMTANGAEGETLAGMRATLRQEGLSEEEANRAFRDLTTLLLGLDGGVDLRLANSIWHDELFPVRPAFVELSSTFFDAAVRALDFDAPDAPETINAWVEGATGGKIEELIDRIDPLEVMFLINTLYFQGDWSEPFDPDRTRLGEFRRLDGSTVEVEMMHGARPVRTQRREEFHAVELFYGREAFSMVVLLPPEGTPPGELVRGVDGDRWDAWMEGFADAEATLTLPRFRLTWKETLNERLQEMGMERAFGNEAEFGRLMEGGAPPGELRISRVQQKTFIEVNEEGTEAAAATSVGVITVSEPPPFEVDRPFLFAIRERFSGTILFLGQVTDPTGGS